SELEDVALTALDVEGRHRASVIAPRVAGLRIERCRFLYAEADLEDPDFRREPTLYVGGAGLRIERNELRAADVEWRIPGSNAPRVPGGAAGGIQITGGSVGVVVRDNTIVGGAWNGITLGSVRVFEWSGGVIITRSWLLDDGELVGEGVDALRAHYEQGVEAAILEAPVDANDFGVFLDRWFTERNDGELLSDGDLRDVRIVGNRVADMGGCALASAHFFELDGNLPDLIGVDGLVVEDNRFANCLRLPPWPDAISRYPDQPFAAVCLAGVGGLQRGSQSGSVGAPAPLTDNRFENNRIAGNARDWATVPTCGVYVQYGRGLTFRGNRVVDNGGLAVDDVDLDVGRRGGVVLGLVTVDVEPVNLPSGDIARRQDGIPALVFHDNVVVARQGRALDALAFGPVSITDNQLTARGTVRLPNSLGRPGTQSLGVTQLGGLSVSDRFAVPVRDVNDQFGGEAVRVINLGLSNELYLQSAGFSGFGQAGQLLDPEGIGAEVEVAFVSGNVLFHDNQVMLDTLAPDRQFAVSSVLLLTLGHVSVAGNQIDAELPLGTFLLADALTFGFTQQMSDNRLTKGVFAGIVSAITLGLMNTTAMNQGTHCFLGLGLPQVSRVTPNQVMSELLAPQICGWIEQLQEAIGFGSGTGGDPSSPAPGVAPPQPGRLRPSQPDRLFPSGPGRNTPSATDGDLASIRESLEAEGPMLLAAADRIHVRSHDHLVEMRTPYENRAALAATAAAADDATAAAERFIRQRDRGRDLRVLGRDRVQGVLGAEKELISVVGRVIGKPDVKLPDNLLVVLSSRKGLDDGLVEANVGDDGLYTLSVERAVFADYFKGNKYLVVSLTADGKSVLAKAERTLGKATPAVWRISLRL
ncbi:MAG: hypothetical protein AAF772_08480, partial [Acidobacteriota bacterium]